ncbi:class I SAM-dependent methyltransferase [Patescibacteria group bacterium]|nr:class I SAM-dependent methyltransferase [Patescibacteria group bacterium]
MKQHHPYPSVGERLVMYKEAHELFLGKPYTGLTVPDTTEFDPLRSEMYRIALQRYPHARVEDIEAMFKYFDPQPHEITLEIGAGNGFFSHHIAKQSKHAFIYDPSSEQIARSVSLYPELATFIESNTLSLLHGAFKNLTIEKASVDAVWSFGALHHLFEKLAFLKLLFPLLKDGARVVIGDVFSTEKDIYGGNMISRLARNFDAHVARYCVTGHEVAFWSDDYAHSMANIVGFSAIDIIDLPQRWWFDSKDEIGDFIYLIHAMVYTNREDCLRSVEETLGIGYEDGKWFMNWPMKIIRLVK